MISEVETALLCVPVPFPRELTFSSFRCLLVIKEKW